MTTSPVEISNPEMSRQIACDKISAHGSAEKAFTATEEECAALAKRFGVIAVNGFSGKAKMTYIKAQKSYLVSGHFEAEVTQECRATFKPVQEHIKETFEEVLVTDAADLPPVREESENEDVVELLVGDQIDYGEIATQWLSLALNPFPRAEGGAFEHIEHDPGAANPFVALKSVNLQNNKKK